MARMPGTDWQGEHGSLNMSHYDVVCIHTIVGYAPAHAAHFSTRADGYIYQSRDTALRSGANYNGNHHVIAIENEDHGPAFGTWNINDGHAVPPFTAAQIEAIAKICAWAYHTHGIPLVLCPNSVPGSRGVAYHREGIDGNFSTYAYPGRVAGGELWTKVTGKVCPGDQRISQLINQIIPRAREIAGLVEDDMAEGAEIKAMMWAGGNVPGSVQPGTLIDDVNLIRKMLWEGGAVPGSTAPGTIADDLNVLRPKVEALETAVATLDNKLDQVLTLLQASPEE